MAAAHGGRRRGRRATRAATATASMLLALVVALGLVGIATGVAGPGDGRLVAPATVAGVDVGGMSPSRAVDTVTTRMRQRLQKPVTVVAGQQRLSVTPSRVVDGQQLRARVRDAVAGVRARGRDLSALQRARAEWLGGAGVSADVAVPVDRAALGATVDGLAAEADEPVTDARVTVDGGWIELAEAESGRALDQQATASRLARAVTSGQDRVQAPMSPVEPTRTVDDFAHVLLLRQNERRLYHYVDGEIAAQWPVAVGTGNRPTPTGWFMVGNKRHRPVWVNPEPDGWGSDMPERIPPGPDNPLGLRALNWRAADGSRTLIRFHGTANTSVLGEAVSHGCVRMANDDVVELYQRVPTGTPIVSVRM